MQTFKEHHHKFLTALLLLGALLIFGSFSSEAPKSAEAASTPGEQSVSRASPMIDEWYDRSEFVEGEGVELAKFMFVRMLTVISTGDVRKNGLLTTSGTVLQNGDQITLDITDNAGYLLSGGVLDTPPSPWVIGMPSLADADVLCGPGDFIYTPKGLSFCTVIASAAPQPGISTNGLSCGSLTLQNVSKGVRTFSTTCAVTSTGPIATLQVDLNQVNYYRFLPGKPKIDKFGNPMPHKYLSGGFAPSNIINLMMPRWVDTSLNPAAGGPLSPLPPATLSWTFDVASVPPPSPPTLTFTGSPTTITQGDSSTLNWSSQNTTGCTASAGWNGAKAVSGTQSVTPPTTTLYTLTCVGPGGSISRDVTIEVNSLNYILTTYINSGLGTITGPGISCPGDCSEAYPSGTSITLLATPSVGYSFNNWIPSAGTICGGQGDTCSAIIDEDKTARVNFNNVAFPVTADIRANGSNVPISIDYNTAANISWSSGNATSCTVSPTSWTGISGSESTNPLTSSRTYILICSGPGGSANDSVTVNVSTPPGMTVTCSAYPMTAFLNENVTWTANFSGGSPPFTCSWSGTNIPATPAVLCTSPSSYLKSYSTIGQKTANVIITDSSSPTPQQASCSVPTPVVRINFDPSLEEF